MIMNPEIVKQKNQVGAIRPPMSGRIKEQVFTGTTAKANLIIYSLIKITLLVLFSLYLTRELMMD